MGKVKPLNQKNVGLLGTVLGSLLVGVPAIPFAASAAPSPILNPCPRIFYEEPFNTKRLAPEGCPPNSATRLLSTQASNSEELPGRDLTPNRIVPADAPTTPARVVPTPNQPGVAVRGATPGVTNSPGTAEIPAQPPLPENRANAIATVMPMDGNVNVRLKNNTNALITYEAIGYTRRRFLPAGQEVVLRNLPVPVTITTVRQDKGLVDVTPVSSQKGLLEVSLNESKNLDDNAGALRIQTDGQVFLN
ncbi:MAG TPA: hypothetical protein DEV81_02140 [Cyanobacteria bacterium UBA11049]|nr:hypothetical protein [Cyanobacteria bacterium UBA11049]